MTFRYLSVDVHQDLPPDWQADVFRTVSACARTFVIQPNLDTSRELLDAPALLTRVVTGDHVARELPWVEFFYRTVGKDILQLWYQKEPVECDPGVLSAMNINVQQGRSERYEAHLDTCLAGLLYVTTQPPGAGGELVVANDPDARGLDQIDADCVRIYPQAGHYVVFDARHYPHYVTPLTQEGALRAALVFAYVTPSCRRAPGLDAYLYGTTLGEE